MTAELRTERLGTALVLTLDDRAGTNLLSAGLCAAGVETLNMSESDAAVRCVVLAGASGQFCHGQAWLGDAAMRAAAHDSLHRWLEALRAHPKPVIAAVDGSARDAGCELALACDLIVASQDARFSFDWRARPEGLQCGPVRTFGRNVSRARLLDWLWLQDELPASELVRLGLVHSLCGVGQATGAALDLTRRLAAVPAGALAAAKEHANAIDDASSAGERAGTGVR